MGGDEKIKKIQALAQSTRLHKALNNSFYAKWLGSSVSSGAVAVFAQNYYWWIQSVPDHIARVFITTADFSAKCETVKNLFSEMGFGHPEKAHLSLLRKFLEELLGKVQAQLKISSNDAALMLPETRSLLDTQAALFGHKKPQISVGALLAQEWQAYTMLVKLYEGSRKFAPLWDDYDQFHEACEYFYVHIGDAEKEHKLQSVRSASAYIESPQDMTLLEAGHAGFLNALGNFWEGVAFAMERAGNGAAVSAV